MRFIFVGDIAFGDHPKTVGFGFYSRYRNGIPPLKASSLFPENLQPDVVFGNFEFPVGDPVTAGCSIEKTSCRGLDSYIPFLQDVGFTILNVANNHMYQHGPGCFSLTVDKLRSAGMQVCGIPDDFEPSGRIESGRERAVVLGWSARPRQHFNAKPPYNELHEPACYDRIKEARHRSATVCVSLHWGEEFIPLPAERERAVARRMIDHGASLVIGHHPHVLREIEEYKDGLIAYSLGNFIGDMTWNSAARRTGCLFVETSGKGTVKGWKLFPALIGSDYFPMYEVGDSASEIVKELQKQYKTLRKLSSISGYRTASEIYMLMNQFLTLLFVWKNRKKYGPGIMREMIARGIASRFSKNRTVSPTRKEGKAVRVGMGGVGE